MDSKRFNIYAGSILGSVLLFLLLNFFAGLIYVGPEHPGGEHEEPLAYAVAVEEPAGEGEAAPEVDLAALAAEADPAAGERVFNKCKACHTVEDGKHGVGPSLWGVVGREIASANGFTYSDALKGIEGQWDLEHLSAFLENPQGYAPGTKMSFAGLPKAEDRVNVIAYLNEADGSPVELAPESTAAAPAPASDAASETAPAAAEPAPASEGTGQAAQAEAAAPAPAAEPAPAAAPAADGEYAALLANASAENGQKVFRKCQACHTLEEGKHRVGPSLWGVVGREAGAAEGFNYSDAMKAFEGSWTLSNLDAYLADPAGFVPGNKMTFAGLKDPQDRIDVITHINEADGSPEPLN